MQSGKVSLCEIFCRLQISLPVLSWVFLSRIRTAIFCSPWHLQCLCLCGLGCGRFPAGSGNSQQGWAICRRVGKAGEQQPAPSQLVPTGKHCSESDSNHRGLCLPVGPFLTNLLRWCSNTELLPSDCLSLQKGMCFFDILLSNTQYHILVSVVNREITF